MIRAPDAEMAAVRGGVALAALDDVRVLRLCALGPLRPLCAGELHLRLGQVQEALILDEDARPRHDLYVCRDEDQVLVLAQSAGAGPLAALLPGAAELDACVLCVMGPYAWELLGALVGVEVYALPHHTFFTWEGWTCLRAGRTGEYSYLLVVPRAERAAAFARLRALAADLAPPGIAIGLGIEVGAETLAQCALESGHFNLDREGAWPGLTPLELQQQWRVTYGHEHPGAAALLARRAAGLRARVTAIAGPAPFAVGDAVVLDGDVVGTVVNAGWSAARGDCVGLALLRRAVAVPGVPCATAAGAPLRTCSAPLVLARSLFVVPGRHRARDAVA